MSDPFRQQQFLTVVDRDEADRRFRAHLDLSPFEPEIVLLVDAHGRVLASDVRAPVDVPGFDRSNVDGFAVRAEDTFAATEDTPVSLNLISDAVAAGVVPETVVTRGCAVAVATGAVLPRGASAVVMIERTDIRHKHVVLSRPAVPGENVTFAGTDIGRGETVLFRGTTLTSRETGVLAAIGTPRVEVVRRPRVGIVSTGDELRAPGEPLPVGCLYDSNSTVLADAVRELGCEPVRFGIVPDDVAKVRAVCSEAIATCDVLLLSGGTSKGAGDVSYRVVAELDPGIVAHGVALKPGKPLCLAVATRPGWRRPIPVAVLPGFPTSAIFTFHDFLAPVLLSLAGRTPEPSASVTATLPTRLNSQRGRTEYVLVSLVEGEDSTLSALPMGKGSGSVTAFGRADGFVTIPRQREYLAENESVEVRLLSSAIRTADLVAIGSHCLGLDLLLGLLRGRGFSVKNLSVGSSAGLDAAKRGECDLATIHLFDPETDQYNRPFLTDTLELVPGYLRVQGIVFRRGDARFEGRPVEEAVSAALADSNCVLANRNRGSGTRVLIDRLLNGARPEGVLTEAKSHSAVVAAVSQGRADWGVTIEPAARAEGLGFLPLRDEQYDFVVPRSRLQRPAVVAFQELLADPRTRQLLALMGFRLL